MSTLSNLASFTSGLYRDVLDGRTYGRTDLLAAFPQSVLQQRVRLERRSFGVYLLHLEGGEDRSFELCSRRRERRVNGGSLHHCAARAAE